MTSGGPGRRCSRLLWAPVLPLLQAPVVPVLRVARACWHEYADAPVACGAGGPSPGDMAKNDG